MQLQQRTCAAAAGARVFVGDSAGRVLELPSGDGATPTHPVDACAAAITCLCALQERAQADPLVVAGSAAGELVFLRGDLELRRFRLAAAVRCIAHVRGGQFLTADQRGALYCVTRHEVLWTELLSSERAEDADERLFPGAGAPLVAAALPVALLDVQRVEARYTLVSAGQHALLLTLRGRVRAVVRSSSPLSALARGRATPDVVLAAGEEGVVYRLASERTDRPDLRLHLEPWTTVPFPVAKLLIASESDESAAADDEALEWLAVGAHGQTALFRGRELVQQQQHSVAGDGLLVDALLLQRSGPDGASPPDASSALLVFQDAARRVELRR